MQSQGQDPLLMGACAQGPGEKVTDSSLSAAALLLGALRGEGLYLQVRGSRGPIPVTTACGVLSTAGTPGRASQHLETDFASLPHPI